MKKRCFKARKWFFFVEKRRIVHKNEGIISGPLFQIYKELQIVQVNMYQECVVFKKLAKR